MPSSNIQNCIEQCWDCRTACLQTLYNHCLQMGGRHASPEHIKIMNDCIEACQVAADFMVRGSRLYAIECSACADICDACADSCEAIGGDVMDRLADICRECADACRQLGSMRRAA